MNNKILSGQIENQVSQHEFYKKIISIFKDANFEKHYEKMTDSVRLYINSSPLLKEIAKEYKEKFSEKISGEKTYDILLFVLEPKNSQIKNSGLFLQLLRVLLSLKTMGRYWNC